MLKIEYVDINTIKPYKNNAKLHPQEQIEQIKKSIEQFGMDDPIGIWKDEIVEGHGRLIACKELGYTEVPIIRLDHLTDEERKAYTLAHNKLTMNSDFDLDILQEELQNIELDMSDFGFDEIELDDIEQEQEIVEDDVPEVPEEPKAKLGDIYQLRNHRLMCGDSTSEQDVAKLMNGVKADMVFTDPPYGMKKENDGVANDNLNYDDLLEFNKKWIPITFSNLKDNGSWYCWGIDEPLMDIYSNILKPMAKQNKITFRNLITWDKGNGQGQLSSEFRMYPIADEKCLFIMCGVQGFNTNQDNYFEEWEPVRSYLEKEIKKIGESDQKIANALGYKDGRTVNHWWSKSQWSFPTEENFKALQEYAKSKGICIFENVNGIKAEYEKRKAEYYSTRAYFDNTHDNMNNVWHFSKTSGEERESAGGHATPKPIALCTRAIKSSSRENENVLDVFGGSGSTLIACEQNNRNCYVMELEPKWVDVIIQRWENFTGEKAVKIN
jgi:DNA modification methylase